MNSVLVTGATGFIGSHVVATLSRRGFDVHALAHRQPPPGDAPCAWHQADVLDPSQVATVMRAVRPTHLLHVAWYAVPGRYWTSGENVAWVQASLDLLRQFHAAGGERVVMAGTCAEYDWGYGYCSESLTPRNPRTLYGTCKDALQRMLDAYAREARLSSAWGRIFFLYGPGEQPRRLVSSVILSLLRGEAAPCSHGRQIRDFLHVQDVADAFVALLESDVRGPVNIGSGQPVALRDVVDALADKLGRRDLIQLGVMPVPPDDPPLLCADVGRLHDEVSWSPRYDLDSGLDDAIGWWKGQLASGASPLMKDNVTGTTSDGER